MTTCMFNLFLDEFGLNLSLILQKFILIMSRSTFTPIVLTVKGVTGHEANIYHKILAQKIASKSGERYEDITRLIRIKASFLVLRAALLCLRGSRTIYSRNIEACEDFAFT